MHLILFFYLYGCFASMYVYQRIPDAQRGQKEVSSSQEFNLEMVVNHHVDARPPTEIFWKSS